MSVSSQKESSLATSGGTLVIMYACGAVNVGTTGRSSKGEPQVARSGLRRILATSDLQNT